MHIAIPIHITENETDLKKKSLIICSCSYSWNMDEHGFLSCQHENWVVGFELDWKDGKVEECEQ